MLQGDWREWGRKGHPVIQLRKKGHFLVGEISK
jgi:hypothetical protein